MTDIMLDLETMSLRPNAAIVSIGAVRFNLGTGDLQDTFYTNVSLSDSVAQGLHVDPNTVMWWMGQSDEARAALRDSPVLLFQALDAFSSWVEGDDGDITRVRLWANSPAFDCVVLRSAYQAVDRPQPWVYRNERDYRTAMALVSGRYTPPTRASTEHDALADALHQARCLIEAYRG